MAKQGKRSWISGLVTALLIVTLAGVAFGWLHAARDTAQRRSATLTVAAETALTQSDFEGAARLALAAMKRHDLPLIGFDARRAELVLAGTLTESPGISGPLSLTDAASAVAWSPDGRLFATGTLHWNYSEDGRYTGQSQNHYEVQLWDAATQKPIDSPKSFDHEIRSLYFLPDGHSILTVPQEGPMAIWDPMRPSSFTTFGEGGYASAMTPDGAILFVNPAAGHLQAWDARTRKRVALPPIAATDLVITPDGRSLIINDGRRLTRWDLATFKPRVSVKLGVVNAMAASKDRLFVAVEGHKPAAYDLTTLKALVKDDGAADDTTEIGQLAVSPDGGVVADGVSDGSIALRDTQSLYLVGTPMKQAREITAMAFSPDGTRLLTGSLDKTVRLWDVTRGRPAREIQLPTFEALGDVIPRTVWMPVGAKLAVVGDSFGTYTIWDIATGKAVGALTDRHSQDRFFQGMSNDNEIAVFSDAHYKLSFVDARTGTALTASVQIPDGYYVGRNDILSADHRFFVAEGSDDHVAIWDLKTGAAPRFITVEGSDGLRFSRDSRNLVVYGYDSATVKDTATYWDLATGKPAVATAELKDETIHIDILKGTVRAGLGTDVRGMQTNLLTFTDAATGRPIGLGLVLPGVAALNQVTADEKFIYALGWDHVLRSYRIDPAMTLRGQILFDAVCRQVLPGKLSRFSERELQAEPLLDRQGDADVCR